MNEERTHRKENKRKSEAEFLIVEEHFFTFFHLPISEVRQRQHLSEMLNIFNSDLNTFNMTQIVLIDPFYPSLTITMFSTGNYSIP